MKIAETESKIKKALAGAGIEAGPELPEKFSRYMAGILEMNEKLNLTSITDEDEFILLNIIDSLTVSKHSCYKEAGKVIDVGTGAGLPGAILAIFSPEKDFVLLDSVRKKLDVVDGLLGELGASNYEILHERAEDAGRMDDYREKFDLSVSRAVAPLPVLAELCSPFVRPGGTMIAMKGRNASLEVKKSSRAFSILGLKDPDILDAGVSGTEHCILVSKKEDSTPGRYPRKAGLPSKKPL